MKQTRQAITARYREKNRDKIRAQSRISGKERLKRIKEDPVLYAKEKEKTKKYAHLSRAIIDRNRDKASQFKKEIGCQINNCGYNQCAAALDFHHINPDEKSFRLSASMGKPIKVLEAEIAKCCVLCSNHHREFHDGYIYQLPPPLGDRATGIFDTNHN